MSTPAMPASAAPWPHWWAWRPGSRARILLLHGLILSFGGIPLLFNGDAIGSLNDYGYQADPSKREDSRWLRRGRFDWERAERRKQPGTVEHALFSQIQKLIAVRKELPAFADFNNRELLPLDNPHLLGLVRSNPQRRSDNVFVIANFDARPHVLDIQTLSRQGLNPRGRLVDRAGGLGIDRSAFVDRLADHVDDTAERAVTDRNRDRQPEVGHLGTPDDAFGCVHRDGAHGVLAKVLGHFEHQPLAVVVGFQRVQDRRQRAVELHVHDGADDLGHLAHSSL